MQLSRFRPRFTVRRLMVIVAILGLVLGAVGWLERRSRIFQDLADDAMQEYTAALKEMELEQNAVMARPGISPADLNAEVNTIAFRWAPKMESPLDLFLRYKRVAENPWLPLQAESLFSESDDEPE